MKGLPVWAIYAIAGLSALVMIMTGVSGSLLLNDRGTINKAFDKIDLSLKKYDEVMVNQNHQIMEIAKHNDKQNHVLDKMCWLITLDYKQRMQVLEKYPLIVQPQGKQ